MSKPAPAPEECAICGATIPRGSKACPECGADERTGWREQSIYDGIDLPGEEADRRPETKPAIAWKIIVAIVALALVGLILRGRLW